MKKKLKVEILFTLIMLIFTINRKSVERTPRLSRTSFVDLYLFVLLFLLASYFLYIYRIYGLVFCYNVICDEINNRLIIYSVKNLKDHLVSRRRKNQDRFFFLDLKNYVNNAINQLFVARLVSISSRKSSPQ